MRFTPSPLAGEGWGEGGLRIVGLRLRLTRPTGTLVYPFAALLDDCGHLLEIIRINRSGECRQILAGFPGRPYS